MEAGVLTVKGEKKTEAKTEKEGYKRVERTYGSFYRRFSLPDSADGEAISAKCKHGVLEIVIPKREAVKPKKLTYYQKNNNSQVKIFLKENFTRMFSIKNTHLQ